MEKIIPYSINIEIEKSKLQTSISWKNEENLFLDIEYIKQALEDYFPAPKGGFLSVIKIWKKVVWMEQKIEVLEKDWKKLLFIKLLVWKYKEKETWDMQIIEPNSWKVVYRVKEWETAIKTFYTYLNLSSSDDEEKIYIKWKWYLHAIGSELIRHELEILLNNAVYYKKAKISIVEELTPKDIKNFKRNINEIEFIGNFKNNDLFDIEQIDKTRKIKTWFFIKWENIWERIKNENISSYFIKKPQAKAHLKIWKSHRTADIDLDELTIMMKSDLIDSKEKYSSYEFRDKCLETDFWYLKTVKKIK